MKKRFPELTLTQQIYRSWELCCFHYEWRNTVVSINRSVWMEEETKMFLGLIQGEKIVMANLYSIS